MYGAAAAHNRAMAEFVDADPRLIGVAMVPLDNPTKALTELRAALDLGLGAACVASEAPRGRSPRHPDHDPVWALLEETRTPFILHVGSSDLSIAPEL